MKTKLWATILLIIAFLGLIDSLYLTYSGPKFHLFEQLCTNSICDDFSLKIFGLHISVYGIIYYLLLVLFSFYMFKGKVVVVALIISALGFLFSLYFLYYQAFIIKGFCIFCLFSLVCTTVYFLLYTILYLNLKEKH
jgi:uncharacterized membrane protein